MTHLNAETNEYRFSFAPYALFCSAIFAVLAVVAHIWFDPVKSVVALLASVGMLCQYYSDRETDLRADLNGYWKKRVSDLSVENFCLGQDMAKLKLRAEALDRENDALAEYSPEGKPETSASSQSQRMARNDPARWVTP